MVAVLVQGEDTEFGFGCVGVEVSVGCSPEVSSRLVRGYTECGAQRAI